MSSRAGRPYWTMEEQERRRRRGWPHYGKGAPMEGLLEYYKPVAGASRLLSVLEKDPVPLTIGAGTANPIWHAAGNYAAGRTFDYEFYLTRAGVLLGRANTVAGVNPNGATNAVSLDMTAWTGSGADGCMYIRKEGSTYMSYLGGQAGVVDTMDAMWTPGVCSTLAQPRSCVPVLWPQGGNVGTIPTGASPLGGAAYDSSLGGDCAWGVGRTTTGILPATTVSMWINKPDSIAECVLSSRGVTTALRSYLMVEANSAGSRIYMDLAGTRGGITYADHQAADWYHVTVSIDNTFGREFLWRVTARRLRDAAFRSFSSLTDPAGGVYRPLQPGDGPHDEMQSHLFSIGGGTYWNCWGNAYVDQIGLWNRVLTLEEIETLYGVGLGWAPS